MTERGLLKNEGEGGNIAVIAAILLVVLIGMLALAVDGGNIFMTENKYRNGVEAAALAGAGHLNDENWEEIVRGIASENGLPSDAGSLSVTMGFYDNGDMYDPFGDYREFQADTDAETLYNDALSDPDEDLYVYNNAVMVSLRTDRPTFFGGIFGRDHVSVSAEAVGIARTVGLFSFGDDPEESGVIISNWNVMSADFLNTGLIHANTDVIFDNAPNVAVSGDTVVSASGEVVGCPESGASVSGTDRIYPGRSLEAIMADLKIEAENQGRVIVMTDENFPVYDSIDEVGGRYDDDGNFYYYAGSNHYIFSPHDGDHDGAVYYFEGENPNGGVLGFKGPGVPHAKNFTIAAEEDLAFSTVVGVGGLYLGGSGKETVYIYTTGNVGGPVPNANHFGAIGAHRFFGVEFRVGGYFGIRPSDGNTDPPEDPKYRIRIRVAAEGIINISGRFTPPGPFYFRSDFGPPALPFQLSLGSTERTEEP